MAADVPRNSPSEEQGDYGDDFAYRVAGSLLRSVRQRCGMTQQEFAELTQLTQSTVSAYETGRRQPTIPMLLGMIGSAGFELRIEVCELDRHDQVLGEWEATLDDERREQLRERGYRFVSDAA